VGKDWPGKKNLMLKNTRGGGREGRARERTSAQREVEGGGTLFEEPVTTGASKKLLPGKRTDKGSRRNNVKNSKSGG